ncbi:MAG: SH3 domain-containing protein [Leptospiraceae bacterium]|nr:SH3 domain-containing protein [Leptospiraceae bacterium]
MKSYSLIIILFFPLLLYSQSLLKITGDNLIKFKDNGGRYKTTHGEMSVEYYWDWNKDKYFLGSETFTIGEGFGKIQNKLIYHDTGFLSMFRQTVYIKNRKCPLESRDCNPGDYSIGNIAFGRFKSYRSNGSLSVSSCYTPDENPNIDKEYDCGIETRYNPDGSVKEVIDHKRKCSYGCGEFTPYLVEKIGRYKVEHPAIKIFKEPNKDSEVIGYLKKGEFFIVLEDTKKLEWIGENIAPFGKIEFGGTWYGSKKTGYIYGSGSFISGPYELEK